MPNLPRHIDAKEIIRGDRVRIELPKNQGILHTIEGIVQKIEVSGGVTYYYNSQGANILAYYPGISGIRVLLISQENKAETIFSEKFWTTNNDDVFAETRDRIV